MCCASAALPPLPQKKSVPPRHGLAHQRRRPLDVGAEPLGRRAGGLGQLEQGRGELAHARSTPSSRLIRRTTPAGRGTGADGKRDLVGEESRRIHVREYARLLRRPAGLEPVARMGERALVAVVVAGDAVHEPLGEHVRRQLAHRRAVAEHDGVHLDDGALLPPAAHRGDGTPPVPLGMGEHGNDAGVAQPRQLASCIRSERSAAGTLRAPRSTRRARGAARADRRPARRA